MAFPHLRFPRIDSELPRKAKPAFFRIPPRDFDEHSAKLKGEADEILRTFGSMTPPPGINPELIFKIRTEKGTLIQEEELLRNEFSVLGKEDGETLVLFANEKDLAKFKERLSKYGSGPEGAKGKPAYSAFFDSIISIEPRTPKDRIGRLLSKEGFTGPEKFIGDSIRSLDVNLWSLASRDMNSQKVKEISGYLKKGNYILDLRTFLG